MFPDRRADGETLQKNKNPAEVGHRPLSSPQLPGVALARSGSYQQRRTVNVLKYISLIYCILLQYYLFDGCNTFTPPHKILQTLSF